MTYHWTHYVMRAIGTNTFNDGGPRHPPGDGWTLRFGEQRERGSDEKQEVACWLNDGFELWLGWPDKWHVFYKAKHARTLACWILWCWIKQWFGLRRWIYYKALRVSCRIDEREAARGR